MDIFWLILNIFWLIFSILDEFWKFLDKSGKISDWFELILAIFFIRFISRICINKPGSQKDENYLQLSLDLHNTVIRVLQTLLQIFFDPSNFLFAFTPMGVRKQVLDPKIH